METRGASKKRAAFPPKYIIEGVYAKGFPRMNFFECFRIFWNVYECFGMFQHVLE